jgi:hypothetical protein
MIKDVAKRILGETALGWLDFVRNPNMPASWGGPFNGQKFRQRIFFDILYWFPVNAIVETGTFRGTTTAFFAATSLPVYTTEFHRRYFTYSKLHFLFNRNAIHLYRSDSRSFLRRLSDDPAVPKTDVFFYLDAHWGADLPLREELDIIFSKWEGPIVMIDDFCVPNSGYTFDDYGPEKALNLDYINPVVAAKRLSVFFPAAGASEETGSKRGSVVLCGETHGAKMDIKVKTLVRYPS